MMCKNGKQMAKSLGADRYAQLTNMTLGFADFHVSLNHLRLIRLGPDTLWFTQFRHTVRYSAIQGIERPTKSSYEQTHIA